MDIYLLQALLNLAVCTNKRHNKQVNSLPAQKAKLTAIKSKENLIGEC